MMQLKQQIPGMLWKTVVCFLLLLQMVENFQFEASVKKKGELLHETETRC